MNKYTKEEQEFLDKAAIAYIQGNIVNKGFVTRSEVDNAYPVALILLTERRKVFNTSNKQQETQGKKTNYCNGGCGEIIPDGHKFCSEECTKAWAFD